MRKVKQWYNQCSKNEKVCTWIGTAEVALITLDIVTRFIQTGNYVDLKNNIILLIAVAICVIQSGMKRTIYLS